MLIEPFPAMLECLCAQTAASFLLLCLPAAGKFKYCDDTIKA